MIFQRSENSVTGKSREVDDVDIQLAINEKHI